MLSTCFEAAAPLFLQRFRLLLHHRQPHGDVKPIDYMFAVGMQILLDLPDVFATIGQKHDLLVFLHPLRLH